MLGWINDCMENLVIEKFGLEAWHTIRSNAPSCKDIKDGGFLKLEHYDDTSTLELTDAVCEYSGLTRNQVLETFGLYFVPYMIDEGYGDLLCCQGSTLKDWMANINAIHHHLQTTFPNKMTMPEFWCEENANGSLSLFYYSARGNLLSPWVVGIVSQVATLQFELDITLKRLTTQGVDGARYTSWIISTKDPSDMYKLRTKQGGHDGNEMVVTTSIQCPMSGLKLDTDYVPGIVRKPNNGGIPGSGASVASSVSSESVGEKVNNRRKSVSTSAVTAAAAAAAAASAAASPSPLKTKTMMNSPTMRKAKEKHSLSEKQLQQLQTTTLVSPAKHSKRMFNKAAAAAAAANGDGKGGIKMNDDFEDDDDEEEDSDRSSTDDRGGLTAAETRKLFPYHVVLDNEFGITQVGPELPRVLGITETMLCQYEIDEVFEFIKPKPAKWTRSWLRKLEDQEFSLECVLESVSVDIFFKGTLLFMSSGDVMLILSPDANNLSELRAMQLTLSDLPAHGAYRDAVFLREHLSRQMNNALKMEKLSKTLQTEKELLESLLPRHAAEGLRKGRPVEPMLHNNVTMFFSDIVGFTNICRTISPWRVIGMLNQLYGIMDYLAKKFHVFKVETIGDAYVCCCGLPESDRNHATNVANFALAVSKLSSHVKSPLDGSPLKLRIGIHSGPCASGIVGVTNPRYCVFGDTVNTTARHESTGEAGRVHCSLTTMIELSQRSQDFDLECRGLVDMKGKGQQPTYWLKARESNEHVNKKGISRLKKEIKQRFPSDDYGKSDDLDLSDRRVVASEEILRFGAQVSCANSAAPGHGEESTARDRTTTTAPKERNVKNLRTHSSRSLPR